MDAFANGGTLADSVAKNAKAMAKAFVDKGYKIISGGTDNHLMLIDLRSKNLTGKIAEEALIQADITINKNMVPFDTQSPMVNFRNAHWHTCSYYPRPDGKGCYKSC